MDSLRLYKRYNFDGIYSGEDEIDIKVVDGKLDSLEEYLDYATLSDGEKEYFERLADNLENENSIIFIPATLGNKIAKDAIDRAENAKNPQLRMEGTIYRFSFLSQKPSDETRYEPVRLERNTRWK